MVTFHSLFSRRFVCNTLIPIVRKNLHVNAMEASGLSVDYRQLAPPLANNRYKGQAGRICVFGGSFEYTGAPYFSAISALKTGADLVHVFCVKDAGVVIKSYSPELMVHPLLDDPQAIPKIEPWLDRFHVIIIGPGLGREPATFEVISNIISLCRQKKKPLVIDADGLFLIAKNPDLLKDYPPPGVILTPNVIELKRLNGTEPLEPNAVPNPRNILEFSKTITVLAKGMDDEITNQDKKEINIDSTGETIKIAKQTLCVRSNGGVETVKSAISVTWGKSYKITPKNNPSLDLQKLCHLGKVKVSGGGSGRRCGGQGDLLSGATATFLAWALQQPLNATAAHDDRAMAAAFAACKMIRECNARAFKDVGRSMTSSDMIGKIHEVFRDHYEVS